ncbi:MAG: tetratricopeptide repeat protein [Chloroflexi bacterium]|nr:tetratricopeptide repeat protein [Chloroflexota bacterium]
MHFRRDWSVSFLAKPPGQRRRRGRWLWLLSLMLLTYIVIWLNQGQIEQAMEESLGRGPTATPFASEYARRGMEAVQQGDIPAAIAALEQAVELQPQQPTYRYELGKLHLNEGDFIAAALQAQGILALDPRDVRGHTLEVARMTFTGEAEAAIARGRAALEADAHYAPLLAHLARAYLDAARISEGVEYAERALAADPQNADVQRTYAYALLFLQDREGAIAHLREATRLAPHAAAAYLELAGVLLAVDRNREAIDTYELLLSRDPQHARANLRLCQAYTKLGQFNQALGYCEDATKLDSADGAAWLQLGELRYNQRDFSGTVAALEGCVASGSQALACWWMRALSHYYLGDCEAAWPVWTAAQQRAQAIADLTVLAYLAEAEAAMIADAECAAARYVLGNS